MRQYTTTMTQRGQVTVPVDVQRLLRIGPRDKVTFTIEGDVVRLTSASADLSKIFGSVKRLDPEDRTSLDELIEEAKDERVERIEREWPSR